MLSKQAFHDIAFMLRPYHNEMVAKILDDPQASENDKAVALTFMLNADVASKCQLPLCQDTGTAIIFGWKGEKVYTGGGDAAALEHGVYDTYTTDNLRYSQTVAFDMFKEKNSGNNIPAQIEIFSHDGDEYKILFMAKGGGSANKTDLYQETKALRSPDKMEKFLIETMLSLGTAACPPYHIAFVIGGTSADLNLSTVKLASAKYYDALPTKGLGNGQAFRDVEMEQKLLKDAQELGIGAQFGGKYFAHDVRVIRLPRHGASCPVGLGVSCSADRNIKAKINEDGIWLETLDANPARLIPAKFKNSSSAFEGGVHINLNRPMKEVLAELTKHPVSTFLLLDGTIIVARDIAHAKFKERLDKGQGLPQYLKDHPVYYAGPAKTPKGYASGSFGPTAACKKHGGFYLGSIGGPAALLAQENIKKMELIEYPELGMEAVYKIEVQDF